MSPPFDPANHPELATLGPRLRELAGDAAHRAGRDYFRKGLVKQGAVAATTAFATVSGSTDYRVSIAFEQLKVGCTCPAHRRSKFCKHVVAVCLNLLERPTDFTYTDAAPPAVEQPKSKRAAARRTRAAAPDPTLQRTAGLETVDRLLYELADSGLLSLGPDKATLLASASELVRALKLRRLSTLLQVLVRATHAAPVGAARAGALTRSRRAGSELPPRGFAELLVELYLASRATKSQLQGRINLDPRLAEDLLGKTWRDEELETVTDLELLELATTRVDDGEFAVETAYLADLPTGGLYAETVITPLRLLRAPKGRHRQRLLVDEAGLYPGLPPRRVKLRRLRRAPLVAGDVDRLVSHAAESVSELRAHLVEHLQAPFGAAEIPVLFRPAALIRQADQVGAVDHAGHVVHLEWPTPWSEDLPSLLPEAGPYVLFGLLGLGERSLRLRCLAVAGQLRWGRGPIYPGF